jgi:predicted metal-dependent phosphoesterase TrpH
MSAQDFFVDLHVHTNYSDGVLTPSETVELASKLKLAAISITDHDTVSGLEEAFEAGKKFGVEIISGVELSSELDTARKTEMHILGYHINPKSQALVETLNIFKRARVKRAGEILKKLSALGINLKSGELLKNSGGRIIGRLHFAKALVEEGFVENISEAFNKYLATGKPAYESKIFISPGDAIKLIIKAGGIPVLAHPYYGHYNNKNILKGLVSDGLMGIEAWHIKHPDHAVKKFLAIAEEFNLIPTGGSDCHGPFKDEPAILGKIKVPYSVIEALENKKRLLSAL